MNKYRIIEKKGEYKLCEKEEDHIDCEKGLLYVPRYIVQKLVTEGSECYYEYTDKKEFTNLTEARRYKRDLELEDGIVIE